MCVVYMSVCRVVRMVVCKFVVVDPHLHGCLGVSFHTELMGHPVPVSSLGFKCPDGFIWDCSYILYPFKMKGPFKDNCPRYYYL